MSMETEGGPTERVLAANIFHVPGGGLRGEWHSG